MAAVRTAELSVTLPVLGEGNGRLVEPIRFHALWEQAASLRLRDGDITVLAEYDQHARIHGGDPEQMTDAAVAAYVALAALIYLHATRERDQKIAAGMGRADDGNRTRMTSLEGFIPESSEQRKRRSGAVFECP